ncbi:MAG: metalloregulator ArsR/SmtB family transcription factor [Pseudomonadota bacterium]
MRAPPRSVDRNPQSTIFNYMVEYHATDDCSLDGVLLALADPTRRAILSALGQGQKRVTDLAAPFDMSLNAVSKHVKTLERAGLVQRRRAGREHFVIANPEPIEKTAAWFDAQRAFWNARLDKLEALLGEEHSHE